MNDLPSKERTRDLLMNWRRWALSCPLDPAEVYYYTECFCFDGSVTIKTAQDEGLTIKGLMDDPNDLWNPPKAAPVTTIMMGCKDAA